MPHRYEGRKLPAMLYAYPFDHSVAVVLLSAGILINLFPLFTPAAIGMLDPAPATMFRVMAVLGGALITWGLLKGKHRWSFTSEMVGMALAAGVFGCYSVALMGVLDQQPGALLVIIWASTQAAACALRARAILIESTTRLQLLLEAGDIKRKERQG